MVYIEAQRFFQDVRYSAVDVQEALLKAVHMIEDNTACPLRIVDENGTELVDEKAIVRHYENACLENL